MIKNELPVPEVGLAFSNLVKNWCDFKAPTTTGFSLHNLFSQMLDRKLSRKLDIYVNMQDFVANDYLPMFA